MKVCSVAGCPELTTHSRCTIHERAADRARGTRQQRGYDNAHTQLRARWRARVEAGQVHCARCGQPIAPNARWALDHTSDRMGYLGPSHEHCNAAAGGRAAHS